MVKRFLDEKGIKYQDFDVAKDKVAREEMLKKTGRLAVPVIDIDGEIVVGFDKGSLEKKLQD